MAIHQILLTLLASWEINQTVELTGSTATIGGVSYWIPPETVGTIINSNFVPKLQEYSFTAGGLLPLTIIHNGFGNDTFETPSQTFARFRKQDDVWQDEFSKVIYVITKGEDFANKENPPFYKDLVNCILFEDGENVIGHGVPEGPYFFSSLGLHRAYRLYSDHQSAFSESTYTNSRGEHSVLPANLPSQSVAIAVPSRLYYKKTAEKPLAGIRLGVKDIFDVSGVKTGNGNRAWYSLYPNAKSTALPVQRLIDAGAIVVGKLKTAQFANMEYGNSDWIDYQSPFNPRGDGYQDPNSSSAGPGAGIASYPWLDVALGTDTGGSIRGPARVQGLYALRPSHGLVSLTHTTPLAPELDTAALIVREPTLLRDSAEVMYEQARNYTSKVYPSQILMADFPANATIETLTALSKFMNRLKSFLNVKDATKFNIQTAWHQSKPESAPDTLTALLNTTYPTLISQRQAKLVRDPFYADYARKHDGRRPFVNPVPLVRWAYGDTLPENAAIEAIREKTIFMDWFQLHVLGSNARTCSDHILVYFTSPLAVYRNTYRNAPTVPFGFAARYWSVMSETPDLVITVGQTTYHSDITNHTEYLPVTMNLMAAKGCDLMLLDLAVDLVNADILKNVTTGASAVHGGDILL